LARKQLGSIDLYAMGEALRKMLDQLARRAQSPSATYSLLAEVAFEPVLQEARRKSPTGDELPDVGQLHEFRLSLKKLRYAAELIEPVLGERFEEVHLHAKRLQNVIGEHQDSVEFQKLVERRYEKAVRRRRTVLSAGLQRVLDQARQERRERYERCAEACQNTAAPKLFEVGLGAHPSNPSRPYRM
jgi:CHAD domain-containing protein